MTSRPAPPRPFPRPSSPEDLFVLPGQRLSRLELFDLVTNADPMGRPDGSPSPLRLASSGDWILKTKDNLVVGDALLVLEILPLIEQFYRRLGCEHPAKQWFLVHWEARCWLCNITPRLEIWPRLTGLRRWWAGCWVWYMQFRCMWLYKLTLDPNPGNYAIAPGEWRAYYIDDEVYCHVAGRQSQIAPLRFVNPKQWQRKVARVQPQPPQARGGQVRTRRFSDWKLTLYRLFVINREKSFRSQVSTEKSAEQLVEH